MSSTNRREPPEPRLIGDAYRELSRAYAQAEEVLSAAEGLDQEPGGFDLSDEVRQVKASTEALLYTIDAIADDYQVTL